MLQERHRFGMIVAEACHPMPPTILMLLLLHNPEVVIVHIWGHGHVAEKHGYLALSRRRAGSTPPVPDAEHICPGKRGPHDTRSMTRGEL